mmetsp:Transcript_5445/g.17172  ORF Transcript_5445/g.17172 Transcript_5445/m.17172 type:complete len:234 (+) Transcript_5445:624-1325(+)
MVHRRRARTARAEEARRAVRHGRCGTRSALRPQAWRRRPAPRQVPTSRRLLAGGRHRSPQADRSRRTKRASAFGRALPRETVRPDAWQPVVGVRWIEAVHWPPAPQALARDAALAATTEAPAAPEAPVRRRPTASTAPSRQPRRRGRTRRGGTLEPGLGLALRAARGQACEPARVRGPRVPQRLLRRRPKPQSALAALAADRAPRSPSQCRPVAPRRCPGRGTPSPLRACRLR